MVGHQMPFLDPALLLFRHLAKHIPKIPAQLHIQCPPATLGDEKQRGICTPISCDVGFRTSPLMELHSCVLWRLTIRSFVDGEPEHTPESVKLLLPRGRVGGAPRGLGLSSSARTVQGISTVLPVVPRDSRAICAALASFRANVWLT